MNTVKQSRENFKETFTSTCTALIVIYICTSYAPYRFVFCSTAILPTTAYFFKPLSLPRRPNRFQLIEPFHFCEILIIFSPTSNISIVDG